MTTKKKPISYFLDHPQIKRHHSLGNGSVPNNWEAGEKPADRMAQSKTSLKKVKVFGAKGNSKILSKEIPKRNEAENVSVTNAKQRGLSDKDVGNTTTSRAYNGVTRKVKPYEKK